MKKIIMTLPTLLVLVACGNNTTLYTTVPGHALPGAFISVCKANALDGKCVEWSPKSNTCVNPKGPDADPPVVDCTTIKSPPITPILRK